MGLERAGKGEVGEKDVEFSFSSIEFTIFSQHSTIGNDHLQSAGTVPEVGYISVTKEIMSLFSRSLYSCGRRQTINKMCLVVMNVMKKNKER